MEDFFQPFINTLRLRFPTELMHWNLIHSQTVRKDEGKPNYNKEARTGNRVRWSSSFECFSCGVVVSAIYLRSIYTSKLNFLEYLITPTVAL